MQRCLYVESYFPRQFFLDTDLNLFFSYHSIRHKQLWFVLLFSGIWKWILTEQKLAKCVHADQKLMVYVAMSDNCWISTAFGKITCSIQKFCSCSYEKWECCLVFVPHNIQIWCQVYIEGLHFSAFHYAGTISGIRNQQHYRASLYKLLYTRRASHNSFPQ